MNIEKLAKHLKEFTLDEINMIAEFDCKTKLERLLNTHKISFEQGVYKYIENSVITQINTVFEPTFQNAPQNFEEAAKYFMNNYAWAKCSRNTAKTYESILKIHIIPLLDNKNLQTISTEDIKKLYEICKKRGISYRKTKDILKLLNQVLKYCHKEGFLAESCLFKICWTTDNVKTKRIIFEGD